MSTKNHSGDKRGGFVPLGDIAGAVALPNGRALTPAAPQARHHFTTLQQVNQLVAASEADADLGFMARLLALCSLPRTNPKQRLQYVRRNGPYALVMIAGGLNKLPYGNIPRLLLAWVCTEAVPARKAVSLSWVHRSPRSCEISDSIAAVVPVADACGLKWIGCSTPLCR